MSNMINEKEILVEKLEQKRHLGRPRRRWEDIIEPGLDVWDVGACVSWCGPYDHGNGCSGSVQGREWLGRLNQFYVHKRDFAPWSC